MLAAAEIAYPPDLYQPVHAHPNASVTLVLSGSLEERVGRSTEQGLALGIVVKPAGLEHDDRFGAEGARTVQIALSAAASAALERRGEVLATWRWIPAAAAVAPFLRLIDALRSDDGAGVHDCAWDVLGALATVRDSADGRIGQRAPAWLAAVRTAVDDDPAAGHRVADLAAAAGVHPVHLAREFRRYYATGVAEHLQRRRLQLAAELLAVSDVPIAAVAARSGFADQSHLGRQLRRRAGITPGELRRATRAPRRRMLQTF